MNTRIYGRRFAPLAFVIGLALATTLVLTACTNSASSATAPSATVSPTSIKEAGMLSKDVNFCFENKSPFPVTLRWNSGVNSNTGEGTLTKGQTVCAEGGEPEAILTTWDSLVTVITAANAPLVYPLVAFHSSKKEKLYETNFFAQGESVTSYFKGHWFMTTRTSDDDWIQFTVAIRE